MSDPTSVPSSRPGPDERLRQVTRRQHGTFTTRQAIACGMTHDQLRHRVDAGRLRRLAGEVLCVGGVPLSDRLLLHAALLEASGCSAVSHGTAAAWWGFGGFTLRPFELVRLRDGTFEAGCLGTVHTTRRLPDSHVAEVDGLRLTTPTRTLFDLAPRVPAARLATLIDRAWARRLTSGPLLDRVLKELSGRGQTGIAVMRELLALRGPDYVPPESNLEARFSGLAAEVGVRDLRRQVWLGDDVGLIGRVDFCADDRRVVFEVDSDLHHTSISDRVHDAARAERLIAEGWKVVRITEFDIWHRPDDVVRRIRETCGRRGNRGR